MAKTKIQIKSVWGSLLFEHESEDNTVLRTVIEANLYEANLYGADLRGANLYEANLYGADLREADLREADLRGANLYGANLRGADLREADLREADLRGANLYGANLRGANLYEAENADYAIAMTRILPEGSLIGWKKCKEDILVKLRIPEEAKRSHAFGRKCRAEYADVLEIVGPKGGKKKAAYSSHDNGGTKYEVGKRVTPDKFDEDWMNECSSGIHFFITKEEALNY